MKRNIPYRLSLILALTMLLSACASLPRGIEPVKPFDVQRYLGTWYEIARLDHRFERGLSNVSAEYSINDDHTIRVVNRGYKLEDEEFTEAVGKAKFGRDEDEGFLTVSFFGPFYGSYIVYELDKENYEYALVSGPDRSYMWLLSRTPQMDAERYAELLKIAKENGFDTDALIKVEHTS